jgi:hypothetical protein
MNNGTSGFYERLVRMPGFVGGGNSSYGRDRTESLCPFLSPLEFLRIHVVDWRPALLACCWGGYATAKPGSTGGKFLGSLDVK